MPQSLVPVLLLATVALSTSNVLPLLTIHQAKTTPLGLNTQYYDNTISNKIQKINIFNNIFCKEPETMSENRLINLCKVLQPQYVDVDNNQAENIDVVVDKEDNYNGEGFRKEQWHNYPRQLDRLQNYLPENIKTDKQSLNVVDVKNIEDYSDEIGTDDRERNMIADTSNEFLIDINKHIYKIDDAVSAVTSPLLILKIRLAHLSNNLVNSDGSSKFSIMDLQRPLYMTDIKKEQDENPEVNDVIKVKREGTSDQEVELSESSADERKTVQKRLFSLWSRLQSLSHKGHELQHRRHLHAFYGLPDQDGNGALTAETRAALMRPPGSPLRWG